jgi:hypothetical protein
MEKSGTIVKQTPDSRQERPELPAFSYRIFSGQMGK